MSLSAPSSSDQSQRPIPLPTLWELAVLCLSDEVPFDRREVLTRMLRSEAVGNVVEIARLVRQENVRAARNSAPRKGRSSDASPALVAAAGLSFYDTLRVQLTDAEVEAGGFVPISPHIKGGEGMRINRSGIVLGKKNNRVLSSRRNGDGYLTVSVDSGQYFLSRMLCLTFHGLPYMSDPYADHPLLADPVRIELPPGMPCPMLGGLRSVFAGRLSPVCVIHLKGKESRTADDVRWGTMLEAQHLRRGK